MCFLHFTPLGSLALFRPRGKRARALAHAYAYITDYAGQGSRAAARRDLAREYGGLCASFPLFSRVRKYAPAGEII